jgi:hypothetical protein
MIQDEWKFSRMLGVKTVKGHMARAQMIGPDDVGAAFDVPMMRSRVTLTELDHAWDDLEPAPEANMLPTTGKESP